MATTDFPYSRVRVPRSKARQAEIKLQDLKAQVQQLTETNELLAQQQQSVQAQQQQPVYIDPPPRQRVNPLRVLWNWLVTAAPMDTTVGTPAPTTMPQAQQQPVNVPQAPAVQEPVQSVSLNEMSGGTERFTPIDLPPQTADQQAPQVESAPVDEAIVQPHPDKALRIEGATPVPTAVPTQVTPEYQATFNGNTETIIVGNKCVTNLHGSQMSEANADAIAGMIEAGIINAEECE